MDSRSRLERCPLGWGAPPSKEWVDALGRGRPMFLLRYDMHSGLANSAALELAGIDSRTQDPPGGRIVRDPATGQPTGRLLERAMELVTRCIPPPSLPGKAKLLSKALERAVELGLTSLQDLVWDIEDLKVHREVFSRDGCRPRVFLRTPIQQLAEYLEARRDPWPSGMVLQGVKGFLDGSLGSRSAWLREPYLDSPNDRGVSWISDPREFSGMVMMAAREEVGVSLHAIGDAAIGMALGMYWECIERGLGHAPLRIEHFQHPSPEDIERMDHPRLVASMQPLHMRFDAAATEERLGPDRAKHSFPIRSLMELRCNLVFGSDWSVADLNPLLGIHAAVSRLDAQGRWPNGWVPEQRIGVVEAIHAYTASAASSVGMGKSSGHLAPGKTADLTVLDRDITRCHPGEIPKARVLMTVVGGRILYHGS